MHWSGIMTLVFMNNIQYWCCYWHYRASRVGEYQVLIWYCPDPSNVTNFTIISVNKSHILFDVNGVSSNQ